MPSTFLLNQFLIKYILGNSAGSRGVRTVQLNKASKVEGRKILKNKQAPMQCELEKEGAHWSFSNRAHVSLEPALLGNIYDALYILLSFVVLKVRSIVSRRKINIQLCI